MNYGLRMNEYQEKAMQTCMPSCDNFSYMMLNLVGEVGEFASKVAKAIRSKEVYINEMGKLCAYPGYSADFEHLQQELIKEAGDILWQLSGLCDIMGWNLDSVAEVNLHKLASRKKRGVIDGNGDNR